MSEETIIKSLLQISVPSFEEKFINQKRTALYKINCRSLYTNKRWAMEKAFSDFENLYKEICEVVSDPPQVEGSAFFNVTSYNELNKRKEFLENFLRECCERKDVLSSEPFKKFLDLTEQAPEVTMNSPKMLSEFNNLPLGIRDFIYLKDEGIIFLVCSDMNIASRLDAYITNINLPWEEKSSSHISVGAFFVFKVLFNPEKGFKFEKLYAKSYKEQTGTLAYNKEGNTVLIGLDSGRIICYKIDSESNFTKYEEFINFKPHSKRVMGLTYDHKTGYIYSVGSDKKFFITEMAYLDRPNEVLEGPAGFTFLYHDKENERLFLTNELGMVTVYLIGQFPPTLINNIELSSDACIRGFEISLFKSYVFTASVDGQIHVLDINKPGKEKLIKEISHFGGKMKLRIVRYYREHNELITGDEKGRIIIWNLKTGKSIFTWNAHEGPITEMDFIPEIKLLLSAGKDKYFRVWKLPDKWIDDEIIEFEQTELKNMSDMAAMIKLQKNMNRGKGYNSDEDSLNGWDYRDEYDE